MPYKDPKKKKEYERNYNKRWYQKNKERHIKRVTRQNKERIKKNRDFVKKYKEVRGCYICGLTDYRCLEFHHTNINKKVTEISKLVNWGGSHKKILTEIEKCQVICANHHRILHSTDHNGTLA